MEALSPSFGAVKPEKPCRVPTQRAALADVHAPSVRLPLRFVLTGLVSLFAGAGLLVARPDILAGYHYNQYVIAATHLFTLGWICSVVMGAMYQLVPVALECRLYSERLARWHFALHLIGFTGMVAMFWIWNMKQVGHFGSIFAAGTFLFIYNLGRTLARLPRWNVIAVAVASALFWLTLTILAGLFLASAKCWPISPFDPLAQMHAHAHLGGVGVFVMMIVGVSYKVLPMFALSAVQSQRRAFWSIALLNAGLLGLFVTMLAVNPWKIAFVHLIVAGLGLYGLEVVAILRARKRSNLDWGLKYFLTAISLLAPLSVLAVALSWPGLPMNAVTAQLENVYGFLALMGVVTLAIIGMLYKIVPFLVWYTSYSKQIGRSRVPALADLYSPRLQGIGYWTFLSGIVAISAAITVANEPAVRWGCALLAGSLLVLAVNMSRILVHLVWPQLEPLSLHPARGTA